MEKDIIVRAIRFLMHVWQEAKKPVLRARMAGKFTVGAKGQDYFAGKHKIPPFNMRLTFDDIFIIAVAGDGVKAIMTERHTECASKNRCSVLQRSIGFTF